MTVERGVKRGECRCFDMVQEDVMAQSSAFDCEQLFHSSLDYSASQTAHLCIDAAEKTKNCFGLFFFWNSCHAHALA